jgi:hypothetical protein
VILALGALWMLATVGMTLIVVRSGIFAPLRALFPKPKGKMPFWGTLLRCMLCLGFWFGGIWALVFAQLWLPGAVLLGGQAFDRTPERLVALVFALSCAGSLLSWFAYLWHRRLGGEEILKQERHPWQDVPEDHRVEVRKVLGELLGRATMQLELVPDHPEPRARAEALKQALDLLS